MEGTEEKGHSAEMIKQRRGKAGGSEGRGRREGRGKGWEEQGQRMGR